MNYAQLNSMGFGASARHVDHDDEESYEEDEEAELLSEFDDDLLQDDANLEELREAELKKEKELEEKAKRYELAREVMELRAKNKRQEKKLDDAAKGTVPAKKRPDRKGQGHPNLEDDIYSLLGRKLLNKKKQPPVEDSSSASGGQTDGVTSSSSSEESGFSLDSRDKHRGKKKKSKKHHKSGLLAKSSKWVKKPQIYPHARLDNQYVMHETAYKDLTFGQFVAGELEIILGDSMKKGDAWARLEMLRKTAYRSLIFDWGRLLQVHAAIIRKIENGKAQWDGNFDQVERLILENPSISMNLGSSSRGVKGKDSKGRGKQSESNGENVKQDKSWWCRDFQANNCSKSAPHAKRIGNRTVQVKHFCATCFQERGVELGHPEKSSACPYWSDEGGDRRQ